MATVVRRVSPGNAAARAAASAPPPPPPARRVVGKPTPQTRRAATSTEVVGKGFIATSVKDRVSTYHEEEKEVEVLRERFTDDDPPAHVRVGAGVTINLGNYESLRIDCAVTIPCSRNRLDECYEVASEFVVEKINAEESAWTGNAQRRKGGKI